MFIQSLHILLNIDHKYSNYLELKAKIFFKEYFITSIVWNCQLVVLLFSIVVQKCGPLHFLHWGPSPRLELYCILNSILFPKRITLTFLLCTFAFSVSSLGEYSSLSPLIISSCQNLISHLCSSSSNTI